MFTLFDLFDFVRPCLRRVQPCEHVYVRQGSNTYLVKAEYNKPRMQTVNRVNVWGL